MTRAPGRPLDGLLAWTRLATATHRALTSVTRQAATMVDSARLVRSMT